MPLLSLERLQTNLDVRNAYDTTDRTNLPAYCGRNQPGCIPRGACPLVHPHLLARKMTLTRFQINWNHVRAIAPFASTDECRHSLCGVKFEQRDDKHVVLCATDGRILGAYRTNITVQQSTTLPFALTMPSGLIARIKPSKQNPTVEILAELNDSKTLLTVETEDGFRIGHRAIEAKFPNWREVVPRNPVVTQVNACFQAAFIAKFDKARKLIVPEKSGLRLWQELNKSMNPIIVDIGDKDFTGVMMPIRTADGDKPVHKFANYLTK